MSTKNPKRVAKPLEPPSLHEDSAERKRQLNVLAQRRYRQRKREHLKKLEQSAANQQSDTDTYRSSNPALSSTDKLVVQEIPRKDYTAEDFSAIQIASLDWPDIDEQIVFEDNTTDPCCFDTSTNYGHDITFGFPLPSLSLSEMSSSVRSPFSPISSSSQSSGESMSRDELHLPMLQLNLLRGTMAIAKRLGIENIVFDIHAKSPFCLANNNSFDHHLNLPSNLRPTAIQRSTPHHPAFDLLPWPAVRDKLILVFSAPAELRPLNARSPTAFIEFAEDFEDSAEGVRIYGDDPSDENNWEIGSKLYANWWWALTSKAVTQANAWREMRGAKLLGYDMSSMSPSSE